MPARAIGRVIAASSDDGRRHAVIGVCPGCTLAMERLKSKGSPAAWTAFLNRAIDDPARYTVKTLPDAGLADLAVAMAGHPDFAVDTLRALELVM